MTYTFRGGIRIHQLKNTPAAEIRDGIVPETVTFPAKTEEYRLLVGDGEKVAKGQAVAESTDTPGFFLHTGIPGTVTLTGDHHQTAVITNDRSDRTVPACAPYPKEVTELTFDEACEILNKAGVFNTGSDKRPLSALLGDAVKKPKFIITDVTDAAPYLSAGESVLRNRPEAVFGGMKILQKALGLRKSDIAVGEDKKDTINLLLALLEDDHLIRMKIMKPKYPQSNERMLVNAIAGVELKAGRKAAESGYLIVTPETCKAVYEAFAEGKAMTERIVTVAGDCIVSPGNVEIPLGAPAEAAVEACGGTGKKPRHIVFGDPVTGTAMPDLGFPITPEENGITVLSGGFAAGYGSERENVCIGCGACGRVCPVHLIPSYIAKFAQKGLYDEAEKWGAASCIGCGSCSYVCPGHVPVAEMVRKAKSAAMKNREKTDGGE